MTIILVQNSRREVKMPVQNVYFRVNCGSFLTTFLSFMTKRANFAFKMRTQVVTPRNRLEVLLFVFVASYLLCCGDVELIHKKKTPKQNAAKDEWISKL